MNIFKVGVSYVAKKMASNSGRVKFSNDPKLNKLPKTFTKMYSSKDRTGISKLPLENKINILKKDMPEEMAEAQAYLMEPVENFRIVAEPHVYKKGSSDQVFISKHNDGTKIELSENSLSLHLKKHKFVRMLLIPDKNKVELSSRPQSDLFIVNEINTNNGEVRRTWYNKRFLMGEQRNMPKGDGPETIHLMSFSNRVKKVLNKISDLFLYDK